MFDASNAMKGTDALPTDFVTWLAQNIDNVRNGAASYQGERVTLESQASRYFTCFSFLFFTTRSITPYYLQGTDLQKRMALTSFVLTLLAGWWGIPFGVIYTPIYLFKNATGGEKSSIANLIDLIEHPEKLKKSRDDFAFGPGKVLLAVFAFIIGLMILLQSYIWLTKGVSPGLSGTAPVNVPGAPAIQRRNTRRAARPESTDPTSLFMEKVQRNLKRAWYPPRSNESSRVKVIFTLDEKGGVSKPRIVQSSANAAMNKAALAAIKDAEFPPLPSVLKPPVDIEFTFDYNVWEHGDKKPAALPADDSSN